MTNCSRFLLEVFLLIQPKIAAACFMAELRTWLLVSLRAAANRGFPPLLSCLAEEPQAAAEMLAASPRVHLLVLYTVALHPVSIGPDLKVVQFFLSLPPAPLDQ